MSTYLLEDGQIIKKISMKKINFYLIKKIVM